MLQIQDSAIGALYLVKLLKYLVSPLSFLILFLNRLGCEKKLHNIVYASWTRTYKLVQQKQKCNLCGKAIEGRSRTIVVSAKGGVFHFNCNRKFVRIVNEYEILIASLKKNGYRFTRYEGIMHSIRRGQLKFKS